MSRQFWFLFGLGIFADGPSSIFVWWYLWQWRTIPGLPGKLARYMSLMALGHCAFRACKIVSWIWPLKGFTTPHTVFSWAGDVLLGIPLWILGFVLFKAHRNGGGGQHRITILPRRSDSTESAQGQEQAQDP